MTSARPGKMLKADRAVERIRRILHGTDASTSQVDQIARIVERVRAPIAKKRLRCNAKFFAAEGMNVRCYRVPGHLGHHTDGTYVWPRVGAV